MALGQVIALLDIIINFLCRFKLLKKIISQKTVGYVIKLHVVSALHIIFIHCVSFCRLRFNKKNYSGNAGAEKNLTDFHNFAACVHSNFFNTVQNAQTF